MKSIVGSLKIINLTGLSLEIKKKKTQIMKIRSESGDYQLYRNQKGYKRNHEHLYIKKLGDLDEMYNF